MKYYPVTLNLVGKRCLVVGGGEVAVTRIRGLLEAGAEVVAVAPKAAAMIVRWSESGRIKWLRRAFRPEDADTAFLVLSTLENEALKKRIFARANAANRLVNTHDDAENCNFIYPAIARSGSIQAAISSGGASPALATRLRDRLEAELESDGTGELAAFLGSKREEVKARLPTFATRRRFWKAVLDSSIPALLAKKDPVAEENFQKLLHQFQSVPARETVFSTIGE